MCKLFYCRDGSLGIATKVFQTGDFSGQQYFCYLIPYRHHLRCVGNGFYGYNKIEQYCSEYLTSVKHR